ncbi:MAG: hypothetical protein GC179_07375 [Anaerolineaceae bacterium]|nr:hypothetical protein [Anaerolineaceae bacterium]
MSRPIVHQLPSDYHEAEHLVLLEPRKLLLINLLALIPVVIALIFLGAWWILVLRLRGSVSGGFGVDWPWWLWITLIFIVSIPIHEGLHGLAILRTGHKPRFGMMLSKGAFYATADNALFWRNDFIFIALAPIVGITVIGLVLIYLLPDSLGYYVGLGIVFNAANSIGDLWMTVVVRRYPKDTLVRDQADSIRIYTNH